MAHELLYRWNAISSATFTATSGQLNDVNDADEAVLFDDFPAGQSNLSHQLIFRLMHGYPQLVDVKSSKRIYHPKIVIVTQCIRYNNFAQVFRWQMNDQL